MSSRPRAPLRPGARVGAFVVREEIGFGATSIVYEAEHRTARQRVAIKVLRSMSDMESELRHRFEREMRLSTALVSMHVPHVYEVGVLPSGLPYIVMERLNGATLADWLAVHRTLPVAVVVEIGLQLCAALEALHALEVVHRDVKPENLLLHQAFDDGYVLKLVDFGICKPLVDDGRALTRRGTVVGTPEYMSPEQVQGLPVDVRTDVYSTGVVLYELLAGRTPFESRDLELLSRAILFGSPPRVGALRDDVSALLEGIVMRAIARDRADRHPTIGALGRELARFAEEQRLARHPRVWSLLPASSSVARSLLPPPPEGLVRRPHPTLITPRIPVRRGWVVGTAAAALAVLIGAGLSVVYTMYQPESAPAAHAEPAEPAPREAEPAALPEEEEEAAPPEPPPSIEPERVVAPEPARAAPPPRPRRRARTPRPPPPSTTVSFAPAIIPPGAANLFEPIVATSSIEESPGPPPAPVLEAPPAPAEPAAPSPTIPPSPYMDDPPSELPENPY